MRNEAKSKKREKFCIYYALCGNIEEAAIKAGYPSDVALIEGAKIVTEPIYRDQIAAYQKAFQQGTPKKIRAGLEQIAFGSNLDIVKLVLSANTMNEEQLQRMNLSMISSIKRDKAGGIEIHLLDRIKAMEALEELSVSDDSEAIANRLIAAISGTSVEEEDDDDDSEEEDEE